jgi:hypothetical protein
VLTVYLFGLVWRGLIANGHRTIKATYDYVRAHFADWFGEVSSPPDLPSYAGYTYRLNRLHVVCALLLEGALQEDALQNAGLGADALVLIIDSMPIVMAKQARSTGAKVAPKMADKGYCASKKSFYYGVKLHVVAERQAGTMPRPAYVSLVKRVKGQERLSAADKLLSTAVSRVRQPIWR